jgi:hypothetical protein
MSSNAENLLNIRRTVQQYRLEIVNFIILEENNFKLINKYT